MSSNVIVSIVSIAALLSGLLLVVDALLKRSAWRASRTDDAEWE